MSYPWECKHLEGTKQTIDEDDRSNIPYRIGSRCWFRSHQVRPASGCGGWGSVPTPRMEVMGGGEMVAPAKQDAKAAQGPAEDAQTPLPQKDTSAEQERKKEEQEEKK